MCFVCKNTFLEEQEIRNHIRTHRNELEINDEANMEVTETTSYNCNKCSEVFGEVHQLRTHMSDKHKTKITSIYT